MAKNDSSVGVLAKTTGKSNSATSDFGDDSDFTVEISSDELSDSDDDDDDYFDLKKKKKKPSEAIAWNEIPLEVDESNMSLSDRIEFNRKKNYRRAAEKVKSWLDTVDSLSLPSNPLDRLLNELGGPDHVAELTGRKSRRKFSMKFIHSCVFFFSPHTFVPLCYTFVVITCYRGQAVQCHRGQV
jgi:hypothetical protein